MPETDINRRAEQQRTEPAVDFTPEERALRRSKATRLCVLSLIFHAGIPIVCLYLHKFIMDRGITSMTEQGFLIAIYAVIAVSCIVAWVFIIIARVRYRESRFAKILMRIYMWIAIGIVIMTVVILTIVGVLAASCRGMPG